MFEILSADELERADRFHFEKDRSRFITARGMLRQILGKYLSQHPKGIHFEYSSYGKPGLGPDSGFGNLKFNLSHSDGLALLAITQDKNIGVDIERIRHDISIEQIAGRFFSFDEINSLDKLFEQQKNELFFQYWTRKEAFLKATGKGLSFPMEHCDVSTMSGREFSPVIIQKEGSDWHVKDLFPGEGFAAAIAIEGGDLDLSCEHFVFES